MGIIDNFDVVPVNTSLNSGRYQTVRAFGEGGESQAYQATDTSDGSEVIIREWHGSRGEQLTAVRPTVDHSEFARQAGQYAKVAHESLINIRDCFSEMDRHFVVIDKIDGRNFAELFSAERPPPLSDLMGWLRELFDVVQYLHEQPTPIVHESIVPANVWITRSLNVKLASPFLKQNEEEECTVVGVKASPTISYRSLEHLWRYLDSASRMVIASAPFADESRQMLRDGTDARSDIYSLAATIYFAMTGVVSIDVMTRVISLMDGKPDPLAEICNINPNVAQSISSVVMKGLSVMPVERYATVSEMHRDFLVATHLLYDELTGLPTRTQFTHHVAAAIAEANSGSRSFAVLVLDIDDYEVITSRGGPCSDKLLINITKKLKLSVRPSDVVARIEAGKFALLLMAPGSSEELMRIAERVQSKLAESDGSETPDVISTVGIVMSGDVAREPDDFLADADDAIATAKQLGTTRCTIYDPTGMMQL